MCNKTPKYDPACGLMLGSVALQGKWIMIMVIKCAYVNVKFKFRVIVSVLCCQAVYFENIARVVCM